MVRMRWSPLVLLSRPFVVWLLPIISLFSSILKGLGYAEPFAVPYGYLVLPGPGPLLLLLS